MPEFIPYSEMIRQMKQLDGNDNPTAHDYVFVKADRKRNKAGEMGKLDGVIVSGLKKQTTATKYKDKLEDTIAREGRSPNHFEHATLNLHDTRMNQTTKVHLRLITRFDGKIVIY